MINSLQQVQLNEILDILLDKIRESVKDDNLREKEVELLRVLLEQTKNKE